MAVWLPVTSACTWTMIVTNNIIIKMVNDETYMYMYGCNTLLTPDSRTLDQI